MSAIRDPSSGGVSSKCHWEAVYRGRATEDLGWYEPEPPTLDLVVRFAGATDAVIDIGGGDSRLLDELSDAGYQHITALDLSETALDPAHNGFVFSTAGDAFSAAFARAEDAVDTARRTQEALGSASWPADSVIRVRMGVHSGEAQLLRPGDVFQRRHGSSELHVWDSPDKGPELRPSGRSDTSGHQRTLEDTRGHETDGEM